MPYVSCEEAQCDYPEHCTHDHWVDRKKVWRSAKIETGRSIAPRKGMRVQKDVGGSIYTVADSIQTWLGQPVVPLLTPAGERLMLSMDAWPYILVEVTEEEAAELGV